MQGPGLFGDLLGLAFFDRVSALNTPFFQIFLITFIFLLASTRSEGTYTNAL